ncbi:MAG: diaminopimelate decarboxylase family protein, partial [Nitrosopumilaceae archaeon]
MIIDTLRWFKRKVYGYICNRNYVLNTSLVQQQLKSTVLQHLWNVHYNVHGELQIDNVSVAAIVEQHGYSNPIHIVSHAKLKKNYDTFYGAFAQQFPVEIAYSYKTNPVPGVLNELHKLGAVAEVISHFELNLALNVLKVDPKNVIFNGPGKTVKSIEQAVSYGIRIINANSLKELHQINTIAGAAHKIQSVGLRLVTGVGWAGQFGFNADDSLEMSDLFRKLITFKNVRLHGLHLHLGTGIKDINMYMKAIEKVVSVASMFSNWGCDIKYLDFGGGFGVPGVRFMNDMDANMLQNGYPVIPYTEPVPSFKDYAEGIKSIFSSSPYSTMPIPKIIFEPGRAITSSAQILVLSKIGEHGKKLILNGGKNISIPLDYEYHHILPVNNTEDKAFIDLYG